MQYYTYKNSKGEEVYDSIPPKKITGSELMDIIFKYKLDVVLRLTGKYPYKATYKFRNGDIFGWTEPGEGSYYYKEYIKE